MANIYEETADMFLTTMAGKMTGMSREQLIAHFKAKCPTEEAMRRLIDEATKTAQQAIDAATRQLQPGQTIAVAIQADPNNPFPGMSVSDTPSTRH